MEASKGRSLRYEAYLDLRDAFKEQRCPVCWLLERNSQRYLADLLDDRLISHRLINSRMSSHHLCNWHARMILNLGQRAASLALVDNELLAGCLNELEKLQTRLPLGSWWSKGWKIFSRFRRVGYQILLNQEGKTRCPICVKLDEDERRYLDSLLDSIDDVDFDRGLKRSRGLCLPHFNLTTRRGDGHRNRRRLLEIQIAKLRLLYLEFNNFARKMKAGLIEAIPEEQNPWPRVLAFLTGEPEVFGNDRLLQFMSRAEEPSEPLSLELSGKVPAIEEIEDLRFENEKLQRRVKELNQEYAQCGSRAAALNFQVYELSEEVKRLKLNLAGAQGTNKMWERTGERLNAEIAALKQRIRELEENKKPTDTHSKK